MSNLRLVVRNNGNKETTERLEQELKRYQFKDNFVSALIRSKKATDITPYLEDVIRLGVLDRNNQITSKLSIRTKTEDKYFTPKYTYDNILKQAAIVDPDYFKSIARRTSVKADLNILEKYENSHSKPFFSFTRKEAGEVVSLLSKKNRTPITIKNILNVIHLLEKRIEFYVNKYDPQNHGKRQFTDSWDNISINEITNKTQRTFLTKSMLDTLLKGHYFGDKSPQYKGLALLTFKGVKISKKKESNEMSLITMNNINIDAKTIQVGVGDYKRIISFDDDEWKTIRQMISHHDSSINNYLIQPFSTRRIKDEPISRWSLVSRLSELSEKVYGNNEIASYKNVRSSGMNYLFATLLMENGISVTKRFTSQTSQELATKCLQQFGEVPTVNPGTIGRNKRDKLRASLIQYQRSF